MKKGDTFMVGNSTLLRPLLQQEATITMPGGEEIKCKIVNIGPVVSQIEVLEDTDDR